MSKKTKSTQASVVLWRGVSPDGRGRVTLWAVPEGGNSATGPTIDLYVAADDLVEGCDPSERLSAATNRKRIVDRIDHRSAAAAGCAAACPHLRAKSCYALHDDRTSGQTHAACRAVLHAGGGKIPDAPDDIGAAVRLAAAMGAMTGRRAVRGCVSGDLSQVPEHVGRAVLDGFRAAGIRRRYVYSHGWRSAVWLREYAVASVDTLAAERVAMARGWTVFRVVAKGDAPSKNMTQCHKDAHKGATCGGCPTPCDGLSSAYIPEHGPRRVFASRIGAKIRVS